MKSILQKIFFTLAVVMTTAVSVYAQVPQGFNFQAVARGATGEILANQSLGVQVSIIQGTEDGNPLYTEAHTITTNPLGLIQIVIGEGTAAEGQVFSAIDFGNDNYFVKLAIDPAGGTEYADLGTTRLLSVPYALVAQKAVEGGSGGEAITEYNLNTTNSDTSFIVNATGSVGLTAIRGNASTDAFNRGIAGVATSTISNSEQQQGVLGSAPGDGTGSQIGVFGSAVNANGTVGRRYGLYGQARSLGRENIGGFGVGLGAGDGEVVAIGDEFAGGSFNVGGFNIGMVGFAQQNLNGNIGVRGYVYGTEGARENRGLSAEAVTTASGRNIGTQSLVHSSQTENIGFHALMFDDGNASTTPVNKGILAEVSGATTNNIGIDATVNGSGVDNTGMILNVNDGSNSNIGLIVNAATAAQLNGNTTITGQLVVNGNIEHTGSITQTSDRNLKENIKNLDDGINTIMKLRPTSYNFRGDGEYKGLTLSRGLHYGLIAQEVEEVLPSLVKDNKHTYLAPVEGTGPINPEEKTEVKNMDYKTMNYTELIPVLIKAVQEQQEEIETLRKQIEALKKNK